MKSFDNFGLSEGMINALKKKGFEAPTPIQELTIPGILGSTKDLVAQAQTGTGKTAAFGVPLIELIKENTGYVQAIILTPTRELAIQVAEEINSLKGDRELSIVPIYGGQSMSLQLRSLRNGIDIVVGTPGRVLDHIWSGEMSLGKLSYFVLDEADEMLNMGFIDDVKEILSHTPDDKRTMLFSATMPREIVDIAKNHMREYDELKVESEQLTVSLTDQIYFEVNHSDKFEALCRLIDMEDDFYGLVFCRTKYDADKIANKLSRRGYDAGALHGNMSQVQRERMLNLFRKKRVNILVATDVAARGLDVHDLTHVINYALPQDPKAYIHRIGRTGRAGKEGNAVTFVTPEEYRKLKFITKEAKTDIRKAKLPLKSDTEFQERKRLKKEIDKIASTPARNGDYLELSKELLKKKNPEDVVASLLQHTFGRDNKKSDSGDTAEIDDKGTTRLYVAHGKRDGLTKKKLLGYIKEKSGISPDNITDIQILQKFSFLTMPFHEAEVLLALFKDKKEGSGPFITMAKKEKSRGLA